MRSACNPLTLASLVALVILSNAPPWPLLAQCVPRCSRTTWGRSCDSTCRPLQSRQRLSSTTAKYEKPRHPKPRDVILTTKDKVAIHATYYEPREPSKSTVPIILLHGWKGNRRQFYALARTLQEKHNHAVVSVDLRGHGDSTVRLMPAGVIEPGDDFDVIGYDMLAAKEFLLKEHQNGKLNVGLLTVVGADVSSILAINFAYYDWNSMQGKHVRGLVLLSPVRSFKGMNFLPALNDPVVRGRLSKMIIVGGQDEASRREARFYHSMLERHHVRLPHYATQAERIDKMDLFLMETNSTLKGTALLRDSRLQVDKMISHFIKLRMTNKADEYPWVALGK